MVCMGLFANSNEAVRFPSCNFCLKKHLGESGQFNTRMQFGRAHPLVWTNPWLSLKRKGFEVMGKLARIAIGVFEARPNHVCRYPTDWVPPCTRLKSSPTTPDSTPSRKGLQYHRMSPWLQTRSWCQRSLTPPRAPWHQARRQVGKGLVSPRVAWL
jgi:hypothetical protein